MNTVWTDNSLMGTTSIPSGWEGRMIICDGVIASSLTCNTLPIFIWRKTWSYHEEMGGLMYVKWFKEQVIFNISANSVIVIDNTPYHSVQVDRTPMYAGRKQDMVSWIQLARGSFLDLFIALSPWFHFVTLMKWWKVKVMKSYGWCSTIVILTQLHRPCCWQQQKIYNDRSGTLNWWSNIKNNSWRMEESSSVCIACSISISMELFLAMKLPTQCPSLSRSVNTSFPMQCLLLSSALYPSLFFPCLHLAAMN